jgi:hypothetical protein
VKGRYDSEREVRWNFGHFPVALVGFCNATYHAILDLIAVSGLGSDVAFQRAKEFGAPRKREVVSRSHAAA